MMIATRLRMASPEQVEIMGLGSKEIIEGCDREGALFLGGLLGRGDSLRGWSDFGDAS